MNTIQWYPGHMVKTKRLIKENLKVIDLVIEIIDARIPESSRNPELSDMIGNKKLLLVINKADLAETNITKKWMDYFKKNSVPAVVVNAMSGKGIKEMNSLIKDITKGREQKPTRLAPRVMIAGIPNVGKSSLINRLTGRAVTKTGDKPGVTKGQQWVKLNNFQLLDIPGVLWPKFQSEETGIKLAVTGAIGDHVFDVDSVVVKLLEIMQKNYPELLATRYKLNDTDIDELSGDNLLEAIGRKRGCIQKAGVINREKAAELVLREFRDGKIGRVSLEEPDDN